jgi:hypothetical protein
MANNQQKYNIGVGLGSTVLGALGAFGGMPGDGIYGAPGSPMGNIFGGGSGGASLPTGAWGTPGSKPGFLGNMFQGAMQGFDVGKSMTSGNYPRALALMGYQDPLAIDASQQAAAQGDLEHQRKLQIEDMRIGGRLAEKQYDAQLDQNKASRAADLFSQYSGAGSVAEAAPRGVDQMRSDAVAQGGLPASMAPAMASGGAGVALQAGGMAMAPGVQQELMNLQRQAAMLPQMIQAGAISPDGARVELGRLLTRREQIMQEAQQQQATMAAVSAVQQRAASGDKVAAEAMPLIEQGMDPQKAINFIQDLQGTRAKIGTTSKSIFTKGQQTTLLIANNPDEGMARQNIKLLLDPLNNPTTFDEKGNEVRQPKQAFDAAQDMVSAFSVLASDPNTSYAELERYHRLLNGMDARVFSPIDQSLTRRRMETRRAYELIAQQPPEAQQKLLADLVVQSKFKDIREMMSAIEATLTPEERAAWEQERTRAQANRMATMLGMTPQDLFNQNLRQSQEAERAAR